MSVTILRTSHEDYFLPEGYYGGLRFNEGWVFFRVTGRERSNLEPFSLGTVAATSNLSDWNDIEDSNSNKYLEPPRQFYIKHIFWGVSPPQARVFFAYPERADRWNLTALKRSLTGDVGYVNGLKSPFNGPFSVQTEIFTVYQIYPSFQVYNPLSDSMTNVVMNFDVMSYTYNIIRDRKMIREFLDGTRRCRRYTVGGLDPSPAPCPRWLVEKVGEKIMDYSKQVMDPERAAAVEEVA